jgi:hypothetical protein
MATAYNEALEKYLNRFFGSKEQFKRIAYLANANADVRYNEKGQRISNIKHLVDQETGETTQVMMTPDGDQVMSYDDILYMNRYNTVLPYYFEKYEQDIKRAQDKIQNQTPETTPEELKEWEADITEAQMAIHDAKKGEFNLNVLSQLSIENAPLDELKQIAHDLKSIKKYGKELKAFQDEKEQAEFSTTVNTTVDELTSTRRQPVTNLGVPVVSFLKKKTGFLSNAWVSGLRKEQAVGWFVNFKRDTTFLRTIVDGLNNACDDQAKRQFAYKDFYDGNYRVGKSSNWYTKPQFKFEFDDNGAVKKFDLSADTLMAIYAHSQNIKNMNHLLTTFEVQGISTENAPKVIAKCIELLPEEQKKMVDAQLEYNDNVVYKWLDGIFYKQFGIHMPKEERFFWISNLDRDNIPDLGIDEVATRSRFVYRGMTKARTGSTLPFTELKYFDTLRKGMDQSIYYVAFSDYVRGLNKYLYNDTVKKTMNDINVDMSRQIRENWIPTIARERVPVNETIDKLTTNIRTVSAVVALGARIPTLAVQFSALPLAIPFMDLRDLPYIFNYALNPLGIHDEIKNLSVFMRDRGTHNIEREMKTIGGMAAHDIFDKLFALDIDKSQFKDVVSDIAHLRKGLVSGTYDISKELYKTTSRLALAPMMLLDQAIAESVWWGRYNGQLTKHGDQQLAIREANYVVRNTQYMNDIRYMSEIYKHPMLRLFTLFKGPQNQIMSLGFQALSKSITDFQNGNGVVKSFTGAAYFGAAIMMVGIIMQLARSAGTRNPVSNPEETAKLALESLTDGYPIVGDMINLQLNAMLSWYQYAHLGYKYQNSMLKSTDFINNYAINTVTKIAKGIEEPTLLNWSKVAGQILPISTLNNYAKNEDMVRGLITSDNNSYKWNGIAAMFYSSYALNFQNTKPMSYATTAAYPKLDSLIVKYNQTYPGADAWHPGLPNVKWKLKNMADEKFDIILTDSECQYYYDLCNVFFKQTPVISLLSSYPDDYTMTPDQLKELKTAWSDAKVKAKYIIERDPTFRNSHRREIEEAGGLKEEGISMNDIDLQNELMAFADTLTREQLVEKGKNLLNMMQNIANMQTSLAKQKADIAPYIVKDPLMLPEGTVVYVEGSESQSLNRNNLKKILMERLRVSEAVAETILNSGSTKKFIQGYIKVMTKRQPIAPKAVAPTVPLNDIHSMIGILKERSNTVKKLLAFADTVSGGDGMSGIYTSAKSLQTEKKNLETRLAADKKANEKLLKDYSMYKTAYSNIIKKGSSPTESEQNTESIYRSLEAKVQEGRKASEFNEKRLEQLKDILSSESKTKAYVDKENQQISELASIMANVKNQAAFNAKIRTDIQEMPAIIGKVREEGEQLKFWDEYKVISSILQGIDFKQQIPPHLILQAANLNMRVTAQKQKEEDALKLEKEAKLPGSEARKQQEVKDFAGKPPMEQISALIDPKAPEHIRAAYPAEATIYKSIQEMEGLTPAQKTEIAKDIGTRFIKQKTAPVNFQDVLTTMVAYQKANEAIKADAQIASFDDRTKENIAVEIAADPQNSSNILKKYASMPVSSVTSISEASANTARKRKQLSDIEEQLLLPQTASTKEELSKKRNTLNKEIQDDSDKAMGVFELKQIQNSKQQLIKQLEDAKKKEAEEKAIFSRMTTKPPEARKALTDAENTTKAIVAKQKELENREQSELSKASELQKNWPVEMKSPIVAQGINAPVIAKMNKDIDEALRNKKISLQGAARLKEMSRTQPYDQVKKEATKIITAPLQVAYGKDKDTPLSDPADYKSRMVSTVQFLIKKAESSGEDVSALKTKLAEIKTKRPEDIQSADIQQVNALAAEAKTLDLSRIADMDSTGKKVEQQTARDTVAKDEKESSLFPILPNIDTAIGTAERRAQLLKEQEEAKRVASVPKVDLSVPDISINPKESEYTSLQRPKETQVTPTPKQYKDIYEKMGAETEEQKQQAYNQRLIVQRDAIYAKKAQLNLQKDDLQKRINENINRINSGQVTQFNKQTARFDNNEMSNMLSILNKQIDALDMQISTLNIK